MLPTKIVVIGAGSAIFGLNTLAALVRSERLRGSRLALVDLNAEALALVGRTRRANTSTLYRLAAPSESGSENEPPAKEVQKTDANHIVVVSSPKTEDKQQDVRVQKMDFPHEEVQKTMGENLDKVKKLLTAVIPAMSEKQDKCKCGTALQGAV